MFCCFVALDDVHEKSTSHHLEKSASFCCPSSRVLAAFHFQPTPPWQPGHQQLLGEVWRFQALGRQIKYFQRVWNLNPPTKQIVCFLVPTIRWSAGHWEAILAPRDGIRICCHQNLRTLHPSNGLGSLTEWRSLTTRRHGVARFTNQHLDSFPWLGIANGSGKCPTLETKFIFHQGPKNSTEPWLWESLSRWWVILKSFRILDLTPKVDFSKLRGEPTGMWAA